MRDGWTMTTIGAMADITDYVANGSFATLRENVSYKNAKDYAVLVRLADFSNGFDESKFIYIDKHAYDFLSKSKLFGGEIIMSNVGSLGKMFICPDLGMPMSLAPNSIVIKTRNNKFYYYLLSSRHYQNLIMGISSTTALPKFNKTSFKKIPIEVPPLSEQERIVAELDLLTGIIDKQKAQLKEFDTLAQSIFYDMFGDPVENERGWESSSFKDTIRLKSGDCLSEKDFQNGVFPVYGGNGISGYHDSYNKDGDYIIIGRVGAYCGNVRYIKGQFWLTDNAFQAFFDTEKFDFHFLCFLLNTINLHRFANQAAQPVISNVGLKDISIICPSKERQQSFSQKIQSIESQKASINRSIAETQKLFDYTMDKYFG